MFYARSIGLILLCTVPLQSVLGQELSEPIGPLNSTIMEPSETTLELQVDAIRAEIKHITEKFGARHPSVKTLQAQLASNEQKLQKLKARNKNLTNPLNPSQPPSDQSTDPKNNEILIELQQLVLKLTNRVAGLEDEVRELKATVQKLSK